MAEATWSFSQTFTSHFQQAQSALELRIEKARAGPSPQDDLNELSYWLAKLSKDLADASGSLPSYDQKQYELQVKTLEKSIDDLRVSSLSKPKFSFKRKVVTPSTILPTIAKEPLKSIGTTDQPSSTHLILSSRSESFLTRSSLPEHSSQTNLSIFDLDHCIVDLLGKDSVLASKDDLSISALHVRNLSNCVLLLPIIEGSALLHDMFNCTIVLGCHQFRMHTSKNIDVLLSISSNPIIETCNSIRFGQYPAAFIDREQTPVVYSVQDFSHIRSTASPHFSLLTPDDQFDLVTKVSSSRKVDAVGQIKSIVPQ
ncbi:hypothetical protein AGABI1DRAFT_130184 [Agaricus bisporus var. burnettii JB137-S8]|uniref:C-CAP/cofactor C-like domain-containing protein n=1 Tax=Agaricus bisporus var. burnettii (strain JB137-S8 / ATCC MYA-4627 / FGSC 10392) TaxID=597362 RepID=K5X2U4_AGABU|nr:uncharacterized protein AGABI1DRAFT_130184 [Agaricus bisporus var. burnettii JB137-S8]EKM77483.1 hypothetical protein AGABI1DRAFT_130184 [Agaricus bisporus var. burnettii JB137-S8]